MAITRANAEVELIDRCGALLALVGKDSTTVSGANASLNGPLRSALGSLGITPAAWNVSDADVAAVVAADQEQLFDVAEWRTLINCRAAYMKVDQKISLGSQSLNQIRDGMNARIKELEAKVKNVYGVGAASLSSVEFSLDFAETLDTNGCEVP